jgi:hypothetical protein
MMCACEEEFARRFYSHQIKSTCDIDTQERIPVTLSFQKGICNTCRGIPEEPHPKAETYGMSSKIYRYYWREILMETTRRFGDWVEEQGYGDWLKARGEHEDKYDSIEKEVIEEIKALHLNSPKYSYQEESQEEVLKKCKVEIINVDGTYVKGDNRKAMLFNNGRSVTAEEYTELFFKEKGYDVLATESVPFHVIFGIFMWILIQGADPLVEISGFDERDASKKGIKGEKIWALLPRDFGTSGYFKRREKDIKEHLAWLPNDKNELLWAFDYWIDPSWSLRQYLWAHELQKIEKARIIVQVLPVDTIKKILQYLVENYWSRFCGWPDLLVYNNQEYFFVEVKSSKDKLSDDQKEWIKGNHDILNLPFKLIKIHKKKVIDSCN